jgi:alpha-beta hydrolase superfamily lysophospholipase
MNTRGQGTLERGSNSGPPLYFHSVSPQGQPDAAVGVIPGYADHGARWLRVMDAWAERGIASVAIDLRGHGRAGGRRGYCDRFEDFLGDAALLEGLTATHCVPAFLFGHSFGGLVATSLAQSRPATWRGLLMTNPLFGLSMPVPSVKLLAGRLASRVLPAFSQPTGLKGAQMTHDAELARAYDEDPLVFKGATARWFTETMAEAQRAIERASALSLPVYVVRGMSDPISSTARARAFFDAAGSQDKTWDARDGLLHEVLNEPEWRPIAEKLADWVLAHK